MAWGDGRQGVGDVVGARLTTSGEVLDADGIPLVTAEGREAGLDLDWGGDQYRLVYSDIVADGGGDVWAVRIGADGLVLDGPLAISSSDQVESRPAVALVGATAIVAYDRFDPAPEVNTLRGYIRAWA